MRFKKTKRMLCFNSRPSLKVLFNFSGFILLKIFNKEFFIECRDRARQRGYFLCEKVTKSTQTTRLIQRGVSILPSQIRLKYVQIYHYRLFPANAGKIVVILDCACQGFISDLLTPQRLGGCPLPFRKHLPPKTQWSLWGSVRLQRTL